MYSNNKIIIIIIYIIFFLGFLLLTILFFHQQIIEGNTYSPSTNTLKKNNSRGFITIKDNNSIATVATTKKEYDLIISPVELKDVDEAYEHINDIYEIDKEKFYASADKYKIKDQYELIIKNLDNDLYEKFTQRIENYNLIGVKIGDRRKRHYIYKDLAAHVIGFIQEDENKNLVGTYGIEKYYEDVLNSSSSFSNNKKEKNSHILLTIDKLPQLELQKELEKIVKDFNAKEAGGIIVNPTSGEVVAMAYNPTFNLNEFEKVSDVSIFNNNNIESIYEFGSIFKPLTVAIGLDSRSIDLDYKFDDNGKIKVDDKIISNFDKVGRGKDTPLIKILSQSLNTGSVKIMQEVGTETFKEYIESFDFDSVTRIDLPREIGGLTENLNSNRELEFANISFGQGLAITPIQMTMAVSTIANGGLLLQPYITLSSRTGKNLEKRTIKKIFNKNTANSVKDLMVKTYDTGIAKGKYRNKNYKIAAKTGTAQLPDGRGGYSKDIFLHSFFGFLPADKPEYLILLFSINPNTEFSSQSLGPSFSRLTNFLIDYAKLTPDRLN